MGVTTEQIARLNRLAGFTPAPSSPPLSPYGQGNLRQSPPVPDSVPRNLPKGLPSNPISNPSSPPLPTQSSKPLLPTPNGAALSQSLTNGAARVAGAVAVGQSLANVASKPTLANGITAVGSALLLLPNPYAQLAGLGLVLGGNILNAFKPIDNQGQQNLTPDQNQSFRGGQCSGIRYGINADFYTSKNGNFILRGGCGIAQFGAITFAGSLDNGSVVQLCGREGCSARSASQLITGATYMDNFELVPTNGEVDNCGDPNTSTSPITPAIQDDGYDPNLLASKLDEARAKLNDLDGIGSNVSTLLAQVADIKSALDGLKGNPNIGNRIPSPLPTGSANTNSSTQGLSTGLTNPPLPSNPISDNPGLIPSRNKSTSKAPLPNSNIAPELTNPPLPQTAPQTQPKAQTQTNQDRFKQPTDCKFSCSALADCFGDLDVDIFDGCNLDGTTKTKKITIQTLPKDRNKTIELFKQMLALQGETCRVESNVYTVPDYWRTRVGQIPQAEILYKSIPINGSKPSYYQLQIPHYNGNKSIKPKISEYQKGNEYAIYTLKDGSTIQVNCSTKQECLRVIKELEKYVNPRFRANDYDGIKYGTRKGLSSARVTPVRLDYRENGQSQSSPDWSIGLLK